MLPTSYSHDMNGYAMRTGSVFYAKSLQTEVREGNIEE